MSTRSRLLDALRHDFYVYKALTGVAPAAWALLPEDWNAARRDLAAIAAANRSIQTNTYHRGNTTLRFFKFLGVTVLEGIYPAVILPRTRL